MVWHGWHDFQHRAVGLGTVWQGSTLRIGRLNTNIPPMFDTITISDEEMDALPDGIEGFLAFESLVRTRLVDMGKTEQDGQPSLDQRYSYFSHLSEAADHFDIPEVKDLRISPGNSWGYDESKKTAQQIDSEVMKLRFRARRDRLGSQVQLTETRRETIQHHIVQLRKRIAESDLDTKKQTALNKKLDELVAELSGQKKLDLAKIVLIFGAIGTMVGIGANTQQNIIRWPETMATIASLLDEQKEETEAKRLSGTPKLMIEDQSTAADDDIPY